MFLLERNDLLSRGLGSPFATSLKLLIYQPGSDLTDGISVPSGVIIRRATQWIRREISTRILPKQQQNELRWPLAPPTGFTSAFHQSNVNVIFHSELLNSFSLSISKKRVFVSLSMQRGAMHYFPSLYSKTFMFFWNIWSNEYRMNTSTVCCSYLTFSVARPDNQPATCCNNIYGI